MNAEDPTIEGVQQQLAAMQLSAQGGPDVVHPLWPFPSPEAAQSFLFYGQIMLTEYTSALAVDPDAERDPEVPDRITDYVVGSSYSWTTGGNDSRPEPFHLPHPIPPVPKDKRLPLSTYGTRFYVVIHGRRPGIYYNR